MNKRTNFEEVANIALLYREKYEGTTMLSYNKVLDYYNNINYNLYIMGTLNNERKNQKENDIIYFISTDEENNKYLVIDPKIDLKQAWDKYIGNLPIDILMASRLYNSFNAINIKLTTETPKKEKNETRIRTITKNNK